MARFRHRLIAFGYVLALTSEQLFALAFCFVTPARGMREVRTVFRVCHRDSFDTEDVLADVPS
jgi:hypothetical protein